MANKYLLTYLLNFLDTHTRKVTKRKLLSLIGKLSFAVVWPGRIFLRRLIDLSKTAKKLHHHITLNAGAKDDINWWLEFLPHWNGSGIFPDSNWMNEESMQLFTDASPTVMVVFSEQVVSWPMA